MSEPQDDRAFDVDGDGEGDGADGAGHDCATGAASAPATLPAPHPLDLAVQWRRYQEIAIARLLRAAHAGDRRLQLVAPPGSGKTLMGLYVALMLGRPIVVLSNTRAIAAQWLAAVAERVVDLEGHFGGDVVSRVSDALPQSGERMPLLVATTYQAFTRQRPAALVRGDGVADRLAPTVAAAHARYGKAGALLVLDECHHLKAWWGEAIGALLDGHDDVAVLALTATPPEDADADERRIFERIVGDVTHEIPLVGAVREGALAPFVDLVHFVRPEQAAADQIAGVDAAWSAWLRAARESFHSGDAWLPGLLHHCRERVTVHPGRRGRAFDDTLHLFDREPDFAVALARYLVREGDDLPAEVYPQPEMAWRLTRDDLFAIVDDYVYCALAPDAATRPHGTLRPAAPGQGGDDDDALAREIGKRRDGLQRALASVGWRLRGDGIHAGGDDGEVAAWLATSRSRVVGMLEVLRHEWQLNGSELCAVVVTDFVRTASGGGGGRALDDAEAAGAIGAFRAIACDEELRDTLPMLATGSEKWIAAELVDVLRGRLGALAVGLHAEPLEADAIGGARGSWLRLELPGHEGELLRAQTALLEREHAHCVVGTRALLGEGWNCRAVDTLVDLTATRSYVAVHQLRGRALRLHGERPEKVAHLWDIVAVPAFAGDEVFAGGVGMADVDRFVAKHQRAYAPAHDGAIERGPGHVEPRLRQEASRWVAEIDAIDEAQWALARDRQHARARWRLGEAVGEDELVEVRVAPAAPAPPAPPDAVAVVGRRRRAAEPVPAERLVGARADAAQALYAARLAAWPRRRAAVFGLGLAFAGAVAVALSADAGHPLRPAGVLLAVAIAAATAALALRWRREAAGLAVLLRGMTPREIELAVVRVVLQAARAAGKRLGAVRAATTEDDAGVTLRLIGGDAIGRARLASAIAQALGGCSAPHHALEIAAVRLEPQRREHDAELFEVVGVVPVPSALGASRKMAETYAEAWRQAIGPCRLVAVRRDRAGDAIPYLAPVGARWLRPGSGSVSRRDLLAG